MAGGPRRGILETIEWLGNKLPEPALLFVFGCVIVMVISQIAASGDWSVVSVRPVATEVDGKRVIELEPFGEPERARTLLNADGLYWAISNLVKNFIEFKPLGIVLTGMLGVGVAERSGMIGALLKACMLAVPRRLLTPMLVFLGVNSSLATDAGYVVLPPLAGALFLAAGRSPVVGIAAVFAGIGSGFSANLFVTSLDPLLSNITQDGARVLDPEAVVQPTCNWWFMAVSTVMLTLLGWGVTARFVEPRFEGRSPAEGGVNPAMARDPEPMTALEKRGLLIALLAFGAVLGAVVLMSVIEGAPMYGDDATAKSRKWIAQIVPILFFAFLVPGLVYGAVTRSVKSQRDGVQMMVDSMAGMAPIIVLCFFAGQFIKWFEYSNLGKMLAMVGGKALAASGLPTEVLIVAFIGVVMLFNVLIASASAKWLVLAPIFVPMLMMVGVSPALTQGAYRVGDSVTNIVTPMNAYLVIILAVARRYMPSAGMGTLVAMMLPYSIVFLIGWTILLLVWMQTGLELGPGGGLEYVAPGGR